MSTSFGVTFAVGAAVGASVASAFTTVSSRVKGLKSDLKGLQTVSQKSGALVKASAELEAARARLNAGPLLPETRTKLTGQVQASERAFKSAERAEKAQHSALDDIPHSLPALMRAHKIQRRCSAVGFDWTSLGPVLDKVHEEIDEVMHEAQQAVVDEAKLEEEVGDLLFATVNLSRHLGVKAEVALQKANLKFERRFREVERIVAARGLEMTGVDLDTMEEVWQEVKRQETDL